MEFRNNFPSYYTFARSLPFLLPFFIFSVFCLRKANAGAKEEKYSPQRSKQQPKKKTSVRDS